MGNKTNVKLKVSNLPQNATPIGVTITYQEGAIPVAVVSIIPESAKNGKITKTFGEIETIKRKKDLVIDIEVDSYFTPKKEWLNKKLKFVGFLDGLSVHHSVGHNTYQAIVKNKAQVLLELTTLGPGLYPTSVNIYRNPTHSISKQTKDDNLAAETWGLFTAGINFNELSPIEFYTSIMTRILKNQAEEGDGGWRDFAGIEKMTTGKIPFEKIFKDERYKKALKTGLALFENIDLSCVNEGSSKNKDCSAAKPNINASLKDLFTSAPSTVLENYLHFLAFMGCTLIINNYQMFVVPGNSVIKRDTDTPEHQAIGGINEAYPSDFSSYSYNDNGYRDIAHVVVIPNNSISGANIGTPTYDPSNIAHYTDPAEKISEATGVLVIRSHPFMDMGPLARAVKDTAIPPQADKTATTLHSEKKDLKGAASESEDGEKKINKQRKETYSKTVGTGDGSKDSGPAPLANFAQVRLFQEKYHDRTGSITLEFNPDWVPGTGGVLCVRHGNKEGGVIFVSFNVTSVTHHISTGAPNSGQAITTISFNCGRIGDGPIGIDSYDYFGYDLKKEMDVQKAYLRGITA